MKLKNSENNAKTLNRKGKLFVISGPSGVGKGTICDALLIKRPSLSLSISVTTRKRRPEELEDIDYFFINEQEFRQMIEKSQLLEYDRHFDNYYGTPSEFVYDKLIEGEDVLCEVDISGALQIKDKYPLAVLFFVQAPSIEELRKRLVKRSSETEEQIQKRLERVEFEMRYRDKYDYVIINDDVDRAVGEILDIMKEITK